MKRSIGTTMLVIASTGFATLAEAQTASRPPPHFTHYTVIRLSTLGGTYSSGYGGVTNNGWVSGDSTLPGDTTRHASVWRDGVITDLGTLGGAGSPVPWPQKNTHGLIVGGADTSTPDPLNENWGAAASCPSGPCEGGKTWGTVSVGRTA